MQLKQLLLSWKGYGLAEGSMGMGIGAAVISERINASEEHLTNNRNGWW